MEFERSSEDDDQNRLRPHALSRVGTFLAKVFKRTFEVRPLDTDSLTARRYTALEDARDDFKLEREGIRSYYPSDHSALVNPLYHLPMEIPDYPPLHDDIIPNEE